MAKLNHQGTIMLIAIFLLMIASLLTTAFMQIQRYSLNRVSFDHIDRRRAEQIMLAGLELGIHEWQTHAERMPDDPQSPTLEQRPLLGGHLSLIFLPYYPTALERAVRIRSTGLYGTSQVTAEIMLQPQQKKHLVLLQEAPSATLQAKTFFLQTKGWTVTALSDQQSPENMLAQLQTLGAHLLYVAHDVAETLDLASWPIAIAVATPTMWSRVQLTSQIPQQSLATHVLKQPGCNFCQAFSTQVPLATTPVPMIAADLSSLHPALYGEFAPSLPTTTSIVALALMPPSAQMPYVRLGLPLSTDTLATWQALTTAGLELINHYLTLAACYNHACPWIMQLHSWQRLNA